MAVAKSEIDFWRYVSINFSSRNLEKYIIQKRINFYFKIQTLLPKKKYSITQNPHIRMNYSHANSIFYNYNIYFFDNIL